MAKYRKLGRTSSQRKAILRGLATDLLYNGKVKTTVSRAKEVRKITEKLITIAKKEKDNYTEKTVTKKVPKFDENNKRVKEEVNGKRVTVFEEVEKTIKKDNASRLNARRKLLKILVPVSEVKDTRKKRANTEEIDMVKMLFEKIAPKYEDRKGGYTRIMKLGPRKGDGAEEAIIELV